MIGAPMDRTVAENLRDPLSTTKELIDYLVASINRAPIISKPFYHIELDQIFPESTYNAMLRALPKAEDYRSMHGRSRSNGVQTRVKIDLFPEYIRHLPTDKRAVWKVVGAALCSEEVKQAFRQQLAPGLKRRFGENYSSIGMYPIPILTRDIPGYSIPPHTDTHWKGITVQLYLPSDDANIDVGTIFHEALPNGSKSKTKQMKFARNSGYAFAVGDNTWHSADPVHQRIKTRDSILLTYFVDEGVVKKLRNRSKRVGNFVLNEIRNVSAR